MVTCEQLEKNFLVLRERAENRKTLRDVAEAEGVTRTLLKSLDKDVVEALRELSHAEHQFSKKCPRQYYGYKL